MKRTNSLNLLVCLLILVASVCACSLPTGSLIPFPQEGMTLSDNFTAKDTIEATTQNARIKILGTWESERASHRFFLEVENSGKTPIKLDFSKIKPAATDAVKVQLNSIEEQDVFLETANRYIYQSADELHQPEGSSMVTIKPKETKRYGIHYNVFKKDSTAISSGDIVKFTIPKTFLNEENVNESLEFKFKCVSSSELKYIQRGPERKPAY